MSVTEINSPFYQVVNGQIYKILLETIASQVKMLNETSEPSDVQKEIEVLRSRTKALEGILTGAMKKYVVNDIPARDLLEGVNVGDLCFVKDASGDPTVESGYALYIYEEGSTWSKISEQEGLDIVFSWEGLEGKPSSSVGDIDDAVSKRHEHTNKEHLDKISDSGGKPTYNGSKLPTIVDGIASGNIIVSDGTNGLKDSGVTTDSITETVSKSHDHTNKDTIDKFTEDSGKPVYDGNKVATIAPSIVDGNLVSADGNNGLKDSGLKTDDISAAITNKHTHTNKTVLDELTNTGDNIFYKNKRINSVAYVEIGSDDPSFNDTVNALNLPDGALITVVKEV